MTIFFCCKIESNKNEIIFGVKNEVDKNDWKKVFGWVVGSVELRDEGSWLRWERIEEVKIFMNEIGDEGWGSWGEEAEEDDKEEAEGACWKFNKECWSLFSFCSKLERFKKFEFFSKYECGLFIIVVGWSECRLKAVEMIEENGLEGVIWELNGSFSFSILLSVLLFVENGKNFKTCVWFAPSK